MNELGLFAGIGGGILGGKLCGFKTVCYVEINKYCQEIIKQRIKDGIFEDAPIWDDIKTFNGSPWAGHVDIVTAGFPCQPFSACGKGLGKEDKKNLWPETFRVIKEVSSKWIFLENVPALLTQNYFGEILQNLASVRYSCKWQCLSATDVGAKHKRDRVWIIGKKNRFF